MVNWFGFLLFGFVLTLAELGDEQISRDNIDLKLIKNSGSVSLNHILDSIKMSNSRIIEQEHAFINHASPVRSWDLATGEGSWSPPERVIEQGVEIGQSIYQINHQFDDHAGITSFSLRVRFFEDPLTISRGTDASMFTKKHSIELTAQIINWPNFSSHTNTLVYEMEIITPHDKTQAPRKIEWKINLPTGVITLSPTASLKSGDNISNVPITAQISKRSSHTYLSIVLPSFQSTQVMSYSSVVDLTSSSSSLSFCTILLFIGVIVSTLI